MTDSSTGTILQSALSDLINLHLLGKQAHWNVHGQGFRSVHLHLDEVVDLTREWSDDVAERIAALGGNPDGRPAAVAADSPLADFGAGPISTDKAVRVFDELLTQASKRIVENLDALEDDLLSQDLLIGIAKGLDKEAWMFRAGEK